MTDIFIPNSIVWCRYDGDGVYYPGLIRGWDNLPDEVLANFGMGPGSNQAPPENYLPVEYFDGTVNAAEVSALSPFDPTDEVKCAQPEIQHVLPIALAMYEQAIGQIPVDAPEGEENADEAAASDDDRTATRQERVARMRDARKERQRNEQRHQQQRRGHQNRDGGDGGHDASGTGLDQHHDVALQKETEALRLIAEKVIAMKETCAMNSTMLAISPNAISALAKQETKRRKSVHDYLDLAIRTRNASSQPGGGSDSSADDLSDPRNAVSDEDKERIDALTTLNAETWTRNIDQLQTRAPPKPEKKKGLPNYTHRDDLTEMACGGDVQPIDTIVVDPQQFFANYIAAAASSTRAAVAAGSGHVADDDALIEGLRGGNNGAGGANNAGPPPEVMSTWVNSRDCIARLEGHDHDILVVPVRGTVPRQFAQPIRRIQEVAGERKRLREERTQANEQPLRAATTQGSGTGVAGGTSAAPNQRRGQQHRAGRTAPLQDLAAFGMPSLVPEEMPSELRTPMPVADYASSEYLRSPSVASVRSEGSRAGEEPSLWYATQAAGTTGDDRSGDETGSQAGDSEAAVGGGGASRLAAGTGSSAVPVSKIGWVQKAKEIVKAMLFYYYKPSADSRAMALIHSEAEFSRLAKKLLERIVREKMLQLGCSVYLADASAVLHATEFTTDDREGIVFAVREYLESWRKSLEGDASGRRSSHSASSSRSHSPSHHSREAAAEDTSRDHDARPNRANKQALQRL